MVIMSLLVLDLWVLLNWLFFTIQLCKSLHLAPRLVKLPVFFIDFLAYRIDMELVELC